MSDPAPHPEDFCHRCGRSNISWWTDSDLFNEAIGHVGVDPVWGGILCPQCFVELSPRDVSWRLVPADRDARSDQLRAVAVAAQMLLGVIDRTIPGRVLSGLEGRDEVELLREKLAALDPTMG